MLFPLKGTSKSYYHSSKSYESEKERAEVNDFVIKPSLKRIPPGMLCPLKGTTKSYYHSPKRCKSRKSSHANSAGNYGFSERKAYLSETEKSRARDSSFGCIDSVLLCPRPLKDDTQSFYQSSSFVKSANRVNENKDSELKIKSLMHKNNQRNHGAETILTHGMSRTETIDRPSRSSEHCSFKNNTQSYSYSFEYEFERVERKERERYEHRLIREHLRQKLKDKPYKYCLKSFVHAGRNLADTDETDG